jgi:hypothetical protein
MFLSEQIKSGAPANASYYRLKLPTPDGAERLFPSTAGAFFKIGDSPAGAPSGEYSVCFYDEEGRPISHSEKKITVDLQNAAQHQN